jgi:hypothetical protein
MNPSSLFSIQGQCLSCNLYENVEFEWHLFLEESGQFQAVNNLDSLLVTGKLKSFLVFSSQI